MRAVHCNLSPSVCDLVKSAHANFGVLKSRVFLKKNHTNFEKEMKKKH